MKRYTSFLNELYESLVKLGCTKTLLNGTSYKNSDCYSQFNRAHTSLSTRFHSYGFTKAGVSSDFLVIFSNQTDKNENYKSFAIEFNYLSDPENPRVRFSFCHISLVKTTPFKELAQNLAFSSYFGLKEGIEVLKKFKAQLPSKITFEQLQDLFSQAISGQNLQEFQQTSNKAKNDWNSQLYADLKIHEILQEEQQINQKLSLQSSLFEQEQLKNTTLQGLRAQQKQIKQEIKKLSAKLSTIEKKEQSCLQELKKSSSTFKQATDLQKEKESILRQKEKAFSAYEKRKMT